MAQGLILGLFLFGIFMNDFFLSVEKSNLCNYADESTRYAADNSLSVLTDDLKKDILKTSNWFYGNYMVLNPDKSNFMILGDEKTNL